MEPSILVISNTESHPAKSFEYLDIDDVFTILIDAMSEYRRV